MIRRRRRRTVPEVPVRSYYGRPVIKPPAWKNPDVPLYLFLGGLAGASATMAAVAEATGRPAQARAGHLTAAPAAAAGVLALIHDLGRPERFLHMLRVVKPTSPLSIGSWLLATFGTLSGAAAASLVTGRAPALGRLAGTGAGLLGPLMMTYTSVLVADTAVPAWHEAHRELPFLFAGGALASGGGAALLATPAGAAGPPTAVAAAGVLLEEAVERRMRRRLGMLAEPYHTGRAGAFRRAGRVLRAAGAVAALAGGSRLTGRLAGVALLAGALCARSAVFEAGRASAADPRYTVGPQRERLARRAAAGAPVTAPRG
ncbi:MAG TPA: NrfD/PsrC family molybdoenzyme membrane anchor subunit [Natronosporangium sp.]|nr:NrfD/PsrC family molybdoenzyme membrane anchor subunit [Natronosporangium sp.]